MYRPCTIPQAKHRKFSSPPKVLLYPFGVSPRQAVWNSNGGNRHPCLLLILGIFHHEVNTSLAVGFHRRPL